MAGAVTGRHQQVCYIKGGKITDYTLMSVFTENTEKPSAQTVDKKYTVNKSTTKNVGSYEWEMEFTGDIIKSDEVAKDFVDVGRRMLVGSDCIRDLILVDLDETAESKSGEFYARQLSVVVAVSEFSDNDGEMQVSGSLYAQSDVTEGSFNVQTKKFTAKSEG
jgi:hypothetical protein